MTYERTYIDFFSYFHSVMPAFILIAVAFVMFLIGIIGIIGLFSENRCLLVTVSFISNFKTFILDFEKFQNKIAQIDDK